ncbi:MAG TPA: HAD family hydrolase [Candidatus Acidoferrum sp.]|nr:HAD family hydrolase [Candidatus Acidoferrum sp.]
MGKPGSGNVKGVLFDLGDVVLKPVSEEDQNWINRHLAEMSRRPLNEVYDMLGPMIDRLIIGKTDLQGFNETVAKRLGIDPENVGWLTYCKMVEIPDEKIASVANRLSENGVKVAYFSNIDLADLAQLVPRIGIRFDSGVASYELGEMKLDSRKGVELALSRLGLAQDQVVLVDDSKSNVEKARALGIDAIHYEGYAQLVKELSVRGIDLRREPQGKRSKRT